MKTQLRFVREFSDQDAYDAEGRGYLSHVVVELDDGRLFPVFFYDPVRLQQDMDENAKHGRPFIADPGMIIVQHVTLETMRNTVEKLASEGFFEHLSPVTREDLASGSPFQWPPQRRGNMR
jgi:hypothetical protein